MKVRSFIFPMLVIALFCGCEKDSSTNQEADNGILELNFEETKQVDNLTYRFSDVSDSRCPSDAVCVWSGYVSVDLDIEDSNLVLTETLCDLEFDLSDLVCGPEIEVFNVRITLVSVDPYPSVSQPVEKEDYKVTLQIDPL